VAGCGALVLRNSKGIETRAVGIAHKSSTSFCYIFEVDIQGLSIKDFPFNFDPSLYQTEILLSQDQEEALQKSI
jgi:hypothetical protein